MTPEIDYYINEEGMLVFTEHFHLERGFCCGRGCRHCPYDYINVPEVKRNNLLAARKQHEEKRNQ
ncbi:MAG: hypothetical protein H6550_11655 [Chitinophagales bacterium]|nr:hypothetical protein [Chitinophagales bacterium]